MKHYKDFLWKTLMGIGNRNEKGIINKLTGNEVEIILGTMKTLKASDGWICQTKRDLLVSRYRVYDWLGMYLNGEFSPASRLMVHAYINSFGNVRRFIQNLENIRDVQN